MAMFYPDRDAGLSMLMAAKMSLCSITRTSLVAQMVQNLPAMQGRFASLGWEDPLEKGMATHSSILAWRIPRTEESSGPLFIG